MDLRYIYYFLFLLLNFSFLSCDLRIKQQQNLNIEKSKTIDSLENEKIKIAEDEGILFLKNFYTQYFKINLKSLSEATSKESEELIQISISDKLREEMFTEDDESMGEGYFWMIKSQDFFEDWLNTLYVYQIKGEDSNIYYVTFSNKTFQGQTKICIKLSLIYEDNHYLIDKIFKEDC